MYDAINKFALIDIHSAVYKLKKYTLLSGLPGPVTKISTTQDIKQISTNYKVW